MRIFSFSLSSLLEIFVGRFDGMLHKEAVATEFSAPLHKSFFLSSFLVGSLAIFILPLHLAFWGAPHYLVLIVLTWMLAHFPLALILSRTGALDTIIFCSSALFAGIIALMCFATGGGQSFALVWLVAPIVEASLAKDKRVPFSITILCVCFAGFVFFAPSPAAQFSYTEHISYIGMAAALIFTGVFIGQLIAIREEMAKSYSRLKDNFELLQAGLTEVVCELSLSGRLQVIAGSPQDLVGSLPIDTEKDWVFSRLHVADRLVYMSKISDVRTHGTIEAFNVRFRLGSSLPGELGEAVYESVCLTMQPSLKQTKRVRENGALLVTLSRPIFSDAPQILPTHSDAEKVIYKGVSVTNGKAVEKHPFGIKASQKSLRAPALEHHNLNTRSAGILESLDSRPVTLSSFDLEPSIRQCRDLLTPVAARRGVLLDLDLAADLPQVKANPKRVRQAISGLLAEFIETCDEGALLKLVTQSGPRTLDCFFSVQDQFSKSCHSLNISDAFYDEIAMLLDEAGCELSSRSNQAYGLCMIMHLPRAAEDVFSDRITGAA